MKQLIAILAVLSVASSAHALPLVNPGFDDGTYNGWYTMAPPGMDGPFASGSNFFGVPSPDGSPNIGGSASSWGTKNPIIAQPFAQPLNSLIEVSGMAWARNMDSGGNWANPIGTMVHLGYDPTGGSDPNSASVVWDSIGAQDENWHRLSVTANSGASANGTIYWKVVNLWALQWNVTYFDATEANVVPEPSSILAMASGLLGMAGLAFRKRG